LKDLTKDLCVFLEKGESTLYPSLLLMLSVLFFVSLYFILICRV